MPRKPKQSYIGAPKGNQNAAIPDEQKRISVHVFLAPETIELLKPYTANKQRGQIIDKAVAEYIERHSNE